MEQLNLETLKQTPIWDLYEKGRTYCNRINMFNETDECYRMYNDDQWHGHKIKGIEPLQLNYIKPIVRYKRGVLHNNNYAVIYSSQNFENKNFRKTGEKICSLLNKRASRIWEKDNLDLKTRTVTRDSAVNGEGLIYVNYVDNEITNEVIKKNNIFYGNENDDDIQKQPYILIKKRISLIEAVEEAKREGIKEEDLELIIADNNFLEESGDSAKIEKDLMVTIITKMYKENGTVHYSKATRYVTLKEDTDSGLTYYPVAHFNWEDKEGSARGEGEVKHLIPNQLEVNKIITRRALVSKSNAYPQKIVNISKIVNPNAIETVGGTIQVKGAEIDDVGKIFNTINPSQMSPDVMALQNDLISVSRELAGAGDIATGDVNPTEASGRAILAVQQASQQPITEQLVGFKTFVEDLARIWLDMITIYSDKGINLEEEVTDPLTNEKQIVLTKVLQKSLKELQANVKVDITPKSPYDKYAQEMSLENLLKQGYFNSQRLGELKIYVKLLDDDSTMPKQKLEEAIEKMEQEQQEIAKLNSQAQLMQQRASQFLNGDLESQTGEINNVMQAQNME